MEPAAKYVLLNAHAVVQGNVAEEVAAMPVFVVVAERFLGWNLSRPQLTDSTVLNLTKVTG
jgi:hypothetical protein